MRGSRRVTPLTNNGFVPSVCQLSVSAKPAEGEKTIVSVKSVKNIRLDGGNQRTVIQGSLKDSTTFSRT